MAHGRAAALTLGPGRDKSLRQRHPWIWSGAVARVDGSPAAGDTVVVRAHDGAFLAWAAYSPASQLRARVCAALAERARDARGRYEAARNAGKALDLLDDVAAAAVAGRIRRIWLEDGRSMAGRVDLASGRIVASEGDDVYDSLAAAVLARAGEVFVVDAAAMPTATGVAAEVH